MANIIQVFGSTSSSSFPWTEIILAFIAIVIPLASFIYNVRISKLQRQKSERDEIYAKLNDFYGPMRLLLSNSKELYDIFRNSIMSKPDNKNFRTLPYILEGGEFDKTENSLFKRIVDLGKKMEIIIEKNAGLIDGDKLNKEMVKLSTHLRIVRMAYEGNFEKGKGRAKLFDGKTFPNEIIGKVDLSFYEMKDRLNVLNKKKSIANSSLSQE